MNFVHNPNRQIGRCNYSNFEDFLRTSPLIYRSNNNFLKRFFCKRIDEQVANKIIFDFIDVLIKKSNEPAKLNIEEKQEFDRLFAALERMAIQTKVKVFDYLTALYDYFFYKEIEYKFDHLKISLTETDCTLGEIVFKNLNKLSKVILEKLLRTDFGKYLIKAGWIDQPENVGRPIAIDPDKKIREQLLRSSNELKSLLSHPDIDERNFESMKARHSTNRAESLASTDHLINQLEQISKQEGEPFSRRDLFRRVGKSLTQIGIGAVAVGVPAGTIGAKSGRKILQNYFNTIHPPDSQNQCRERIKQLDQAEMSGALNFALPCGLLGAMSAGFVAKQSDSKQRILIERIVHGLWQQPIGQNINKENFYHITRRSLFEYMKNTGLLTGAALIAGTIGTSASVLAAQPYRLIYGTPAEQELQAIDPENTMNSRVRRNHAWEIFFSDLQNKALFYSMPIMFACLSLLDERNLTNLDYLIKSANKSPEKISLIRFTGNGAIVCHITDRSWFDVEMKEPEFSKSIKDLEKRNIIQLEYD